MLVGFGQSGTTHDFFCFNSSHQVWNGSSFVSWSDGSYTSYRVTASESGTSGRFTGTQPSGTAYYSLRIRAGTLASSFVVWEDWAYFNVDLSTIDTNAANAASYASNAYSYSFNAWQAALQLGTQPLAPFGARVYAVGTNRGLNSFRIRDLTDGTVYNQSSPGWEAWDDTNAANGYYDNGWTPLDSVANYADLSGFGLVSGHVYHVEAIDYNNNGSGWTGPMLWDGASLSTIATVQDTAAKVLKVAQAQD